jgi:hypothetical protein
MGALMNHALVWLLLLTVYAAFAFLTEIMR